MYEELIKRIELLEYHQTLLLQLIDQPNRTFTKLIVLKQLGYEEVKQFYDNCENLNNEWQKQKAEGFVNFHPLLKDFSNKLTRNLNVSETIEACIDERIYPELMIELKKYL